MNFVYIAQITGVVTIFIIFILQTWIAINPRSSKKLLRTAILWFAIYVFFLFLLRIFTVIKIGTIDQLRIVSGFSSLLPLVGTVLQMIFDKKIDDNTLIREEGEKHA